MTLVKLPGKKGLTQNKKLLSFLNPDNIYIPLASGTDTNIECRVKEGDKVFKGEIIGVRKGNFKTPIFSSVSGQVVGFEEVSTNSLEKVLAVVIKNDKKEKIITEQIIRKELNSVKKDEFLDIVEKCGIIGMGGAGFPTFYKYKTTEKINTLIINAVECEPYITADYVLIKEKIEDILETIDAILEINDINEAIIAIKSKHKDLIKIIQKYIGSYLKISIKEVPDKYPMGWERVLIKKVKGVTYDKLPIEKGIVVNNVSTIYAISSALKYNKPLIERIVTFTGDGLSKPKNVLLKMGTKVSDVFESLGIKKNVKIIAGGPMMGVLSSEDLVVTPDLNNVLVLKKSKECKELNCLRCGKCASVCPALITPVLIKDNLNNKEYLKQLHPEKCIGCGLCSYICPSKIRVRDYVSEAKQIIKEGK